MIEEKKQDPLADIIAGTAIMGTIGFLMNKAFGGGKKMFGEEIPKGVVREMMVGVMEGLTLHFERQTEELKDKINELERKLEEKTEEKASIASNNAELNEEMTLLNKKLDSQAAIKPKKKYAKKDMDFWNNRIHKKKRRVAVLGHSNEPVKRKRGRPRMEKITAAKTRHGGNEKAKSAASKRMKWIHARVKELKEEAPTMHHANALNIAAIEWARMNKKQEGKQ